MRIKILHTADVHIGMKFENTSFSGAFSKIRLREIKETFFRMIDYAKKEAVDFFIVSGDLFENDYVTRNDIREIAQGFESLEGTHIILIAGNHDPLLENSYYENFDFGDHVYIFNEGLNQKYFKDKNTMIWGHSWSNHYIESPSLNAIEKVNPDMINVLVAHGDVYSKKSRYLPIDKKLILEKGFDYIGLGHIHKKEFVDKKMAYPGSPEPLDFSELGEHGFIFGTIEKGRTDLDFIPFAKRRFVIKEIVLTGNMTEKEILKLVLESDEEANRFKHMYRIILKGVYSPDIMLDDLALKAEVETYFEYVELLNMACVDYDLEKLKKDNQYNLIGVFIEKMESLGLDEESNRLALNYGLEELLKDREL